MRKFDQVEVIDETVALYRRAGVLVGLTSIGNLIVELSRSRHVELHPHQVDLAVLSSFDMDATWAPMNWLAD